MLLRTCWIFPWLLSAVGCSCSPGSADRAADSLPPPTPLRSDQSALDPGASPDHTSSDASGASPSEVAQPAAEQHEGVVRRDSGDADFGTPVKLPTAIWIDVPEVPAEIQPPASSVTPN